MKVLVQRVRAAKVEVAGELVGAIDHGLVALIGIEKSDDAALVDRMAARLAGYRLFGDDQGKMNQDIRDVAGAVLAVSQFTLVADTRKGRRPGFSAAAAPDMGRHLYDRFVSALEKEGLPVVTGRFGADMQVHLINDGPVTFMLEL